MPDSKITALTSISTSTDPANDPLVIVDVSDTSMAATGTTKKVTLNQLLGASGTATLASATITGDLTVDTSTLKVDSANDRVGVGTTTPVQKLEVATLGSDTRVRINSTSVVCTEYFRSGTGLWLVGSDSTNAFKIARGSNFGGSADYFAIAAATADCTWYDGAGGTRMTLNSTGLGVGASPNQPIQLSKSNTSTALTAPPTGGASLRIQNTSSTNNNFGSVEFYNAAGLFGASINCQYTNQATPTNDLVFVVRGSGGGIEAARIDSSGNVGIGVTPELKLRVDGPDAAPATSGSSTTNGAFRIGAQGASTNLCVDAGVTTTGGVYGWFQARSRANYATNYDLVLNPNGGNVGIGVTSPSYNLDVRAAAATANVQSSTGTNAVSIVARNTGGSFTLGKENSVGGGSGVFGQDAYASVLWSTGAYPVVFGTNGAHRLQIDSVGNMIPIIQTTAPTLTLNGQMVFNLTSNTNLRISVRGTDGVTRTANITLA